MMKILFHKSYILTFIIVCAISNNLLFAKPTLEKIEIDSSNHIFLYFEQIPKFTTSLDSSKTGLTVVFKNTFISNQANTIENSGIFQRIYYSKQDSNLILNIKLKEKSGYTTLIEPYSQRVVINLFNWTSLTKSEDLFHTALLALEDTLYDVSEKYLIQSSLLGNPKSAAILGLLYSNQKKINRASKFSEFGQFDATYFPDIYNILANIYKYRSDSINFEKYKTQFEKSTANPYVPISFLDNIPSDTLSETESKILDSLIYSYRLNFQSDTSNDEFTRFNKLFDSNYTPTEETTTAQKSSWNALPLWLRAIIGVFVAFLLVLIFQYFRWRNMQIKIKQSKQKEYVKRENKDNFSGNRQEKKSPAMSPQMIDTYVQNQSEAKETINSENQSKSNMQQDTSLVITEEKVKQLSNILENIKATKEEETLKKNKQSQPPLSAKLELALNLAEEQKRIKQNKIEMSLNEFISTTDKLKSTAQKLGLEENSIEIKQAIDNLINDKTKLQDLQSKFESFSSKNKI